MFDWKKAVGTVAPLLGTAIGGPFGGIAGKFIADALNLPEGATEEDIAAAYNSDPEAALKLRQAEYDFKKYMRDQDIKEEELVFKDREDARKRDTLIQQKKGSNQRADVLAYLAVGTFILVIISILWGWVPGSGPARDLAIFLFGVLCALVKDVYQFEFGSSKGSKEKADQINVMKKGF